MDRIRLQRDQHRRKRFPQRVRLEQANLQANIAASLGSNFRYFGPGTGTSPLPIYMAYFGGLGAAQAGKAATHSSALFQDTAFVNDLARFHPQPRTAADRLDADSSRIANALRVGLPANFLVANSGSAIRDTSLYNSRDQFRLDSLNGTETSRVVQLISRISW